MYVLCRLQLQGYSSILLVQVHGFLYMSSIVELILTAMYKNFIGNISCFRNNTHYHNGLAHGVVGEDRAVLNHIQFEEDQYSLVVNESLSPALSRLSLLKSYALCSQATSVVRAAAITLATCQGFEMD